MTSVERLRPFFFWRSFALLSAFPFCLLYEARHSEKFPVILRGKKQDRKNILLGLNELYAFKSEAYDIKYDADNQQYLIEPDNMKRILYCPGFMDRNLICVSGELVERTKYIGENGFGQKVEVTKTFFVEWGIKLFDITNFNAFKEKYTITFNITPNEAKSIKDQIAVLLVCCIRPYMDEDKKEKYIYHFFDRKEPRFDYPIDASFRGTYLSTIIKEIWVYNVNTGVVYKKVEI